ncbi:MAG: imidazole glycerol phosphate synthase subunit HisH [archaeon]
MILIYDYGVGNLYSVRKAFERIGAEVRIGKDLENADAVVLPGVGNYSAVSGVKLPNVPVLGICLGMQLLLEKSEEGGKGFGLVPGRVVRFPDGVKRPQMGWNEVESDGRLLKGKAYFYFANSYYCKPEKGSVGWTDYGVRFCSILEYKNLFGVQFHPEKSGEQGLQVLRNFVREAERWKR